jgi:hypothetical protein
MILHILIVLEVSVKIIYSTPPISQDPIAVTTGFFGIKTDFSFPRGGAVQNNQKVIFLGEIS